jgi:alcohol dehydrogenase (cytochrome c)
MHISISRGVRLCVVAIMAAMISVDAQQGPAPTVTDQDILDGLKDPSRWLTYSGDYSSQRHSPLTQIAPQNVRRLTPQWIWQSEQSAPGRGLETTPLLLDGILYVTGLDNVAWALDARTGREIWRYRRELPARLTNCCGPNNKGFGMLGDRLFMTTLDAHVVALNRKTGRVIWDVPMEDYRGGYAGTVAPLVVKDKVIVGVAGADSGIRGFIDAYDAQTGKRLWRFYTIPAPEEPGGQTWPADGSYQRGGGGTWVTGSYDPELNLLFWGSGNPGPQLYGDLREGDNLYSNSLVVLDADTGQLRWHYQFTPHDTHDWDSTHTPVLAEVEIGGRPRKVVMVANRNGFFYTLDRATGRVLVAKPFVETSWANRIDPNGRPIVQNATGTTKCLPDQIGATNFMPASYDPVSKLFFVAARESCALWTSWKPDYVRGEGYRGGASRRVTPSYSALRAIDPTTGERRWEVRYPPSRRSSVLELAGGVMSTAAGLVFAGDPEGNFNAYDARTGENLWHYQTGAPIHGAGPISYLLDSRQYVLIPSGTVLIAFALPQEQ